MLSSRKITTKWYPFGMLAQNYNAKSYRFGFNTQERTDEISGTGNHNTARFDAILKNVYKPKNDELI